MLAYQICPSVTLFNLATERVGHLLGAMHAMLIALKNQPNFTNLLTGTLYTKYIDALTNRQVASGLSALLMICTTFLNLRIRNSLQAYVLYREE